MTFRSFPGVPKKKMTTTITSKTISSSEIYPKINDFETNNFVIDEESSKDFVKQPLGYYLGFSYVLVLVAVLGLFAFEILIVDQIPQMIGFDYFNFNDQKFIENSKSFRIFFYSSIFMDIVFYSIVLGYPNYSVNYHFIKVLPLLLSSGLFVYSGFICNNRLGFFAILLSLITFIIKFVIFSLGNDSKSCLVSLKPWILENPKNDEENVQGNHYPALIEFSTKN